MGEVGVMFCYVLLALLRLASSLPWVQKKIGVELYPHLVALLYFTRSVRALCLFGVVQLSGVGFAVRSPDSKELVLSWDSLGIALQGKTGCT